MNILWLVVGIVECTQNVSVTTAAVPARLLVYPMINACAYLAFCIMHTIFILEAENAGDIVSLAIFHDSPLASKISLESVKSSKRGYIKIHKTDYINHIASLMQLSVHAYNYVVH